MINVNKIEYFTKLNVCEKPWMKIYTSKGEIEIPLSTDYDEEFYANIMQEISKLSSGAKINMSYDFRDEN